jgi:hypothetical protein
MFLLESQVAKSIKILESSTSNMRKTKCAPYKLRHDGFYDKKKHICSHWNIKLIKDEKRDYEARKYIQRIA